MSDAKTCRVDVNNGKARLECRKGMSLFAALKTKGILLPTGCGARGICGQCKVTVTEGDVDIFSDSEVKLIPEAERAAGKRLACQFHLIGDVGVSVPEYVFEAKEHAVVLDSIVPLTYDIKRFGFKLTDGGSVPHKAGQFLTLIAKIPEPKSQPMRCFSFATPSSVVDRVDIIVRRNPKGVMTPYLFEQAKPGDEFRIIAPYGDFYLRDTDAPCVWIGGGSGLSPFLGMLQDMIDKGVKRAVHLFFGAVLPKDLYYVQLLQELAATHDWFKFTPALSGEERCPECVDYGLITDVVAKYVADAGGLEAYLCGGPGMIGACIKLLAEKGIDRNKIYYDRF